MINKNIILEFSKKLNPVFPDLKTISYSIEEYSSLFSFTSDHYIHNPKRNASRETVIESIISEIGVSFPWIVKNYFNYVFPTITSSETDSHQKMDIILHPTCDSINNMIGIDVKLLHKIENKNLSFEKGFATFHRNKARDSEHACVDITNDLTNFIFSIPRFILPWDKKEYKNIIVFKTCGFISSLYCARLNNVVQKDKIIKPSSISESKCAYMRCSLYELDLLKAIQVHNKIGEIII